ncbi:DUF1295 domain-containing protein [Streptomyces sp. NPDC051109]|uniref:DUF1295 domain-containing protein n=1 Tax=Streptomyces sp. NPDC051109 TaxID=3365642 RepID=UPI00106559B1
MTAASREALGSNLAAAAGAAAAVLLLAFAVGTARRLHRTADIAWGLAFAAIAVVSYVLSAGYGDGGRRLLVATGTVVWGVRLAGHLAWRGRGHGEDPRYTELLARGRGNPQVRALLTVYVLQAGLVWLVSLPVQAASYVDSPVGVLDVLGAALWAVGLGFEAVGDFQLARFKADPAHRDAVMDRGLWAWTRHPNYFGDSLVWWGLYLPVCGTWRAALLCAVSPVVMTLLLTVGSGKRLLEVRMADRPGFADYTARTSGFLPLPPRGGRA